jgi:hypothetical protein
VKPSYYGVKYLFSFLIQDGEHEYLQMGVVTAQDQSEADKKAFRTVGRFLGTKMKWNRKTSCFESRASPEYRIVRYQGIIGEATLGLLLSKLSW